MIPIAIADIPMGYLQHLGKLKLVATGGARFAGPIVINNNWVSMAGKAVVGFATPVPHQDRTLSSGTILVP